ncbi:unnamed protein product [Nezara viridula]|uniref:Uncharacterized protein n=1 Tax=Nezara viridula TaxID=85310 RepID=A0A9P0E809_NEZVI|nr:unnamed protein product [Nezara viridula]
MNRPVSTCAYDRILVVMDTNQCPLPLGRLFFACIKKYKQGLGDEELLTRDRLKRESTPSSSPLVFLFNKSRRKFADVLDIDLPEFQTKKVDIMLSDEETTDEVPHVIVKIKTSDKGNTRPEEPFINMTKYMIDDRVKKGNKYKPAQIISREAPRKPGVRVLNLTKSMFDYNAQKIYHTVNGIRLRLSKEHDQRIILQMVQKQVERGLRELRAIKEKCDKDFIVLSNQRRIALGKLAGLREVMKQKKALDENLSRLLDNAVAFNVDIRY